MRPITEFRVPNLPSFRATIPLLVLAVGLSACSATAPVADAPPDTPAATQPVSWADVERMDVGQYPDVLPPVRDALVHDVPQALMNSTADDGSQIELDGFRVQVFSSSVREEAAVVEDAVERWLSYLSDGQRNRLGLSDIVAVYSFYRPPFYRIRVGDFEQRDDAVRLANALQRQWTGALVVPDRVTVMR